ncbi:hypothetical protein [Microbacterium sp.]|uniref:hypothetical protein n=1 Tax=Microbacterium sp. TaxID=51671 RepID=UPI003A91F07E
MSGAEFERDESSPIPRIRHAGRLIGFVVVVLLVGAAAFVAGTLIRPPQEAALSKADASVDVWAKVERRVVYEGFTVAAVVGTADRVDVVVTEASPYGTTPQSVAAPPSAEGPPAQGDHTTSTTDRVVVSAAGVRAGKPIVYGQLIAEVSGRPVFSWPRAAPLYRDLIEGDTGNDVRGVQTVLRKLGKLDAEPDGIFGARTLNALARLYAGAGYELPVIAGNSRGLSWREFAAIPALPATVISAAPEGSVLTADNPLASVRSNAPTLTATATAADVDQLRPGAQVAVVASGHEPVKSTVAALGEFQTDEKTNISGYPLSIVYPSDLGTLEPGTSVTLRSWDERPPTLAVPSTAVRQDSEGAYVLVRPFSNGGKPQRLPVKAAAQAGGWVALAAGSKLLAGEDVLVSGTDG